MTSDIIAPNTLGNTTYSRDAARKVSWREAFAYGLFSALAVRRVMIKSHHSRLNKVLQNAQVVAACPSSLIWKLMQVGKRNVASKNLLGKATHIVVPYGIR